MTTARLETIERVLGRMFVALVCFIIGLVIGTLFRG